MAPLIQDKWWAPGLVCMTAEKLAPSGCKPQTVQPVLSHIFTLCSVPQLHIWAQHELPCYHCFKFLHLESRKKIISRQNYTHQTMCSSKHQTSGTDNSYLLALSSHHLHSGFLQITLAISFMVCELLWKLANSILLDATHFSSGWRNQGNGKCSLFENQQTL